MASCTEKVADSRANTSDTLQETKEEPLALPEGGWRAWSVLLGVWFTQFCTFGYTNSYGVYNDFYVREYLNERYTSSQISWIGSVQVLLLLSSGLVSGRAFDAGYFISMMIGGSFLFVFSLFMLSLTQPEQYYQVFLAQGLGTGIAMGLIYLPGFAVLSHYFRRRRAMAMAIAASGSAVGGTLHPIMLNSLFHGSAGFHSGVRASAALIFGLLALALLLVKPQPSPAPKKHRSLLLDLRKFFSDTPYVMAVIGSFIFNTGSYFPLFFLQLDAIKNGLAPGFAFYTLVILNGASIVGRITPSVFVSSIGVFNLMIPSVVICATLVFCIAAIKDIAGTIIFTILYGFFSGVYAGLYTPMISSFAEEDCEIGFRMGISFTASGLGGLIGTPIAGALLSTSFVWWRPITFSGLCLSCGALCFTISRFLVSKKRKTFWL